MSATWQTAATLPKPLQTSRTLVMGILNTTEDSFSDGGKYNSLSKALVHARAMVEAGADLIDIGGESTRPGAQRVSESQELERTQELIAQLSEAGIYCSIDTMRGSVAKAAVEAGAVIVNDVSAGLADPEMLPIVAELGVTYIGMHWRAHSAAAMEQAIYRNVVAEVRQELAQRVDACLAAGIAPQTLILDPGLGFSKDADQNWQLLAGIEEIESLGFPLLIGASRKRFLRALEVDADAATATISAWSAGRRHWGVRVHDVSSTVAAVKTIESLQLAQSQRAYGVER